MGIEPLDWGAKALIYELFGRVANLMAAKHFGTDWVPSSRLVDTKGVEPSASAMRMQRSPN